MSDSESLNSARLFIALWPAPPVRVRLTEQSRRLHGVLAGKLSRPDSLHLTLVFIGNLARDRVTPLQDGLDQVRVPAFQLHIDQADCWKHNQIAFVRPSQPPAVLFDLVTQLEQAVEGLGIDFDRRPYTPHVTLLRKAVCEMANPAIGRVSEDAQIGPLKRVPEWGTFRPIPWSAENFVLVESVSTPTGSRYEILRRYALL